MAVEACPLSPPLFLSPSLSPSLFPSIFLSIASVSHALSLLLPFFKSGPHTHHYWRNSDHFTSLLFSLSSPYQKRLSLSLSSAIHNEKRWECEWERRQRQSEFFHFAENNEDRNELCATTGDAKRREEWVSEKEREGERGREMPGCAKGCTGD